MQEQLLQEYRIDADNKNLMYITGMYNDRPNRMIIELLKMILGDDILENMAIKKMKISFIRDKFIPKNVQDFIVGKFFIRKKHSLFIILIMLNITYIILIQNM